MDTTLNNKGNADEFINNFIKSVTRNEMPSHTSEHISLPFRSSEIISNPLTAPDNTWKEFLCVELTEPTAFAPKRIANTVGYDLYAFESVHIPAWEKKEMNFKVKIHMPPGVYGRIAPNTTMIKQNIDIQYGIIDPTYKDELIASMRNNSNDAIAITRGQQIAHLILEEYRVVPIKVVPRINDLFATEIRERVKNEFYK